MTGEDAFLNELAELRKRFSLHRYFTVEAVAPEDGGEPLGTGFYSLKPSDDWWTKRFRARCYGSDPAQGCVKFLECERKLECSGKRDAWAGECHAPHCSRIDCVFIERFKDGRSPPDKELDDLCPFKHAYPERGEEGRRAINPHRLLQCYVNREEHLKFLQDELQYIGGYYAFFDWSGDRREGAHFQKNLGDVADLPWSYYQLSEGKWVAPELGLGLQRLFERWREVIQRESSPGKSKFELYREDMDRDHHVHCVTDGEISFFIFAWRLWGLTRVAGWSWETAVPPQKPLLVGRQLRTIQDLNIPLEPLKRIIGGQPGDIFLQPGISLAEELEIEGLARIHGGMAILSGRFFNLVEYLVTSRFISDHVQWSGDDERKARFEKFLSSRARAQWPVDLSHEIEVDEFRELLQGLFSVLEGISPIIKDIGLDPLSNFEAESRFPLLLYLIWRMQSPMPFCHLWFPTTNLSLNRAKDGHLADRYEGEGGDCVTVFAQLTFDEGAGRPRLLTGKEGLVRLIKRHHAYMQVFMAPIIDRVMFGKHAVPQLEAATSGSAAATILIESYAHNIGAHALPGLKRFLAKQWNGLRQGGEGGIFRIRNAFLQGEGVADKMVEAILRTHSQIPEILSYLQGKSAFWNAISRAGNLHGGQFYSLWDLIDEFNRNNAFCGTIGASEGFHGIEVRISFKDLKDVQNDQKDIPLGKSRIEDDYRFRFGEEIGEEPKQRKESFVRRVVRDGHASRADGEPRDESQTVQGLRQELKAVQGLRKLLDAKPKVFLPEGVVGQHAVWTIWENILRNVKHCVKRDSDDVIPFCIQITEEEDLYRLECWLRLPPRPGNSTNPVDSWLGILDSQGRPNMGGVSQSILCAGMALGIDFIDTEKWQRQGDPRLRVLQFAEYDGLARWSFCLWKGEPVGVWKDHGSSMMKKLAWPKPTGRYRLFAVSSEEEGVFRREAHATRHAAPTKGNEFPELYDRWLEMFLYDELNDERSSTQMQFSSGVVTRCYPSRDAGKLQRLFCLFHGTHEQSCQCKRSRAHRVQKIPFAAAGFMGAFGGKCPREENAELFEVLATRINVFDNRLKRAADSLCFDCQLKKCELDLGGVDKDGVLGECFGLRCRAEDAELEGMPPAHFVILHLSYLEKLSRERNEAAIRECWGHFKNQSFVFITTGRGRARDWVDKITDEAGLGIREKLRYIPVENLEACFFQAPVLNSACPAFGAKFALVKALLGS